MKAASNSSPRARAGEVGAGAEYSATHYYSTAHFKLVIAAHQALAKQYRPSEFATTKWYWTTTGSEETKQEYRKEHVGPFVLHSGPLAQMPLPLVALYLDSQIKTYMDRDALGDTVRQSPLAADLSSQLAIRTAREREIAKRISGGSLDAGDLQIAIVEYSDYVVGGMIVNPGVSDATIAEIMQSPSRNGTSITALQANYRLPPEDPFLARRENEIVDLIRYFRIPDHALKRIFPPSFLHERRYRVNAHLIRALTISEAFAVTERWMKTKRRTITTGVCETPNEGVKFLFEGQRGLGGVPHRLLTEASGAELYPVAYANRPEGKTKIYTLYTFDFDEICSRSKVYRERAIAAYQ